MMIRVLVTGGRGGLGSELVPKLLNAGCNVRVLSRQARPIGVTEVEWAQVDLADGAGLDRAVEAVDAIMHAASDPFHTKRVDVEGTGRLLAVAHQHGVSHFVYISIVGIDRIPFYYYRHKLAAEKLIERSGVPYSILRTTQFHSFLDERVLPLFASLPVGFLPHDWKFQPMDTGEAAQRLADCVAAGPGGRLADIGGPKIYSMAELSQSWIAARGVRRKLIPVRFPGKIAAGFRQGFATIPQNPYGNITWEHWLRRKYGPDWESGREGAPGPAGSGERPV